MAAAALMLFIRIKGVDNVLSRIKEAAIIFVHVSKFISFVVLKEKSKLQSQSLSCLLRS